MNILDPIGEHAKARPDHPAIEDMAHDQIVSYSELDRFADAASARLREHGISRDDIVGVILPDSIDYIVILCALARLGAVFLSVDGRLPPHAREAEVEGLEVKAAIAPAGLEPLPNVRMLDVHGICHPAAQILQTPAGLEPVSPFSGDHPLTVIASSGTTGAPKRLLLTHAQVRARTKVHIDCMGLTASDRYLSVVYLAFYGGRFRLLMTLQVGGTVVINCSESPAGLIEACASKRITFTFLTPAHLRRVMQHISAPDPVMPSVTIAVSTSKLFPEERMRARRRLTPNLLELYGANEFGSFTRATPADQNRFPEAVGRLLNGVEAQIVDQHDKPVPAGEIGFIRFRAPYASTAYLDNSEATARHFREGWFYPGDLAAMNEDGYVFHKGRADDAINNSGAKFYPAEVERVLLAHPAVEEAAVVAWPHPVFQEVAGAYVVANSRVSSNELRAFCGHCLVAYKVPARITFLEALPKNMLGKVVKARLRDGVQSVRAETSSKRPKPTSLPLLDPQA